MFVVSYGVQLGPHRVEAIVCCFGNLVDRENLWKVLNTLKPLEQAVMMMRLGPMNCTSMQHKTAHWILDVTNPQHGDIAKRLVKAALSDTELPNLWNIRLNGEYLRRSLQLLPFARCLQGDANRLQKTQTCGRY